MSVWRKAIYASFCLALLSALYFTPTPIYLEILNQARQLYVRALFKKTVVVNGLDLLAERDLHLERFEDWPVLSWHLKGSQIEGAIGSNPMLSGAELKRCSRFSWNCFELELKERSPAFLASLQERIWLVGSDGTFISPIPGNQEFNARLKTLIEQRKVKSLNSTPLVSGLVPDGTAAQFLKARADLVSSALDALKQNLKYTVKGVELQPSGELAVNFQELPAQAVFSGAENSRLVKEISRFNRVMRELQGREASVGKIDLTFDSFAVVSLRSDSAQVTG